MWRRLTVKKIYETEVPQHEHVTAVYTTIVRRWSYHLATSYKTKQSVDSKVRHRNENNREAVQHMEHCKIHTDM